MAASGDLVPDEAFGGGIGQRVVRNYVLSVVRLIVGQLIGVVTLIVLSRRLDESSYALFAGFSIAILAGYFVFSDPLTTVLSRPAQLPVRVVDATMTALLGWMGVVSCAVIVVGAVVGWSTVLVAGIVFYALNVALAYPPFMMLWRQVRTGEQALLGLVERAVFQISAVTLVVGGVGIEVALGAALALAAATFSLLARRMYRWPLRLANPRLAWPVLLEARHPFGAVLAVSSVDLFAIPAVGMVAGAAAAGRYAWAASVLSAPVGFIATAVTALQPAFARMDADAVGQAIGRCLRVVGALSVALCASVAVLAPTAVGLFLPSRWDSAIVPLWVLLAGATVHGCTSTVVSLLNARGSLAQVARWQIVSYGLGFAVMVALAAPFGARGAAVGYLLSRVMLSVPLARHVREAHDIHLLARTTEFAVVGAIAAAVGLATAEQLGDTWLGLIAAELTVAVTVTSLLLLLMRRALIDDLAITVRLLRGRRSFQASKSGEPEDRLLP